MGTVTAIGSPEPEPVYGYTPSTTTSGNITASSITTTRPSVSFYDWEMAVKFAAVIAKQYHGVKVRKVDGRWAVQWIDYGPVLINPVYPTTYPTPYQPYIVTYTTRSAS